MQHGGGAQPGLGELFPRGWHTLADPERRLHVRPASEVPLAIRLAFLLLGLVGTPLAAFGLALLATGAVPDPLGGGTAGEVAVALLLLLAAGLASLAYGLLAVTGRREWLVAPNSLEIADRFPGYVRRKLYFASQLNLVRDDWSPHGGLWSLWLIHRRGRLRLARIEGLLPAFEAAELLARNTGWPLRLVVGLGGPGRLLLHLQPRGDDPHSLDFPPDAPWGTNRDFAGLAIRRNVLGTASRPVIIGSVELLWRDPRRAATPLGAALWHGEDSRQEVRAALMRLAGALGTHLVEDEFAGLPSRG